MPSSTDTLTGRVTEHADMETMTAELATCVIADLEAALEVRGKAVLAVSGGSTPADLYRTLSQAPIDWARITVLLVDERWVAPDAPGSNERFVRETLLQGPASAARLAGLKTPAASPFDAVETLQPDIAALGPPDVVILGMGADGHTASWFPHARGLDEALAPDGAAIAAIEARPSAVTGDHLQRMTLTRATLARAGRLLLMMRGADKRAALEAALGAGDVAEMPVRALLRAGNLPLDIHWTA